MNFKHKYMFLLPGLLVLLGILIFPIGFTVRLSLSSWDSFYPGLDFIGIENYIRLFTDDLRFWEAFGRLSMLSLTTVFLQYVICLLYTSPSPRDKRQSRMPSSA